VPPPPRAKGTLWKPVIDSVEQGAWCSGPQLRGGHRLLGPRQPAANRQRISTRGATPRPAMSRTIRLHVGEALDERWARGSGRPTRAAASSGRWQGHDHAAPRALCVTFVTSRTISSIERAIESRNGRTSLVQALVSCAALVGDRVVSGGCGARGLPL